jgi:hypothetical protein
VNNAEKTIIPNISVKIVKIIKKDLIKNIHEKKNKIMGFKPICKNLRSVWQNQAIALSEYIYRFNHAFLSFYSFITVYFVIFVTNI